MDLVQIWQSFQHNVTAQMVSVCAVLCMLLSFVVAIIMFCRREPNERDLKTFVKFLTVAGLVSVIVTVFFAAVIILSIIFVKPYDPFADLIGG